MRLLAALHHACGGRAFYHPLPSLFSHNGPYPQPLSICPLLPHQGLEALAQLDAQSFAFPHLIGCGLAGGDWQQYEAALEAFADEVAAPVVIYHIGGGTHAAAGGASGSEGRKRGPAAAGGAVPGCKRAKGV